MVYPRLQWINCVFGSSMYRRCLQEKRREKSHAVYGLRTAKSWLLTLAKLTSRHRGTLFQL